MENQEFSLHDYLHTLSKRFSIIVEATLLIVFFVMIFSYYQIPVFEAKGRVMIQKDDYTLEENKRVYRYNESLMNYIEILKSTVVRKQVNNRLNLFFKNAKKTGTTEELKKLYLDYFPSNYAFIVNIYNTQRKLNSFFKSELIKIKKYANDDDINGLSAFEIMVLPVSNTEILEVSVKYRNPVLCEYISNQLYEIFSMRLQENQNEEYVKKIKFINSQMNITLNRIKEFENKIEKLKIPGKIYNISKDVEKIENEIRDLRLDKEQAIIEKGKAKISHNQIHKKLENENYPQEFTRVVQTEHESMFIASLKQNLVNMEIELVSFSTLYGKNHPKIIDLKKKMDVLNKRIYDELSGKARNNEDKSTNPFYNRLVTDLVEESIKILTNDAKIQAIDKILKNKEKEYSNLPDTLREFNILERELNISEKTYNMLLENLNEIKIKEASIKTKVIILDRAYANSRPLKPNYKFNFILALLAGILTGITLAFLIEHLDRSIKSPEEAVSTFKLPLFARIPKIKGSNISDTEESPISPMLLTYFEPKNVISEQFKMLMINSKFGFKGINEKNSAIMINSAEPGEGKSIVTANLAITYALAGYKTIIVDADFHKPYQHRFFNIDNFHGLTDIMLGEKKDALIKATPIENLFMLPSGAIPPSPAMFFESDIFKDLIQELKKEYDIVLFDTAPTSNISDSLLIVPHMDNLLFVISLRHTDRQIITKTLKDIDNIFQGPVGLICNKVSIKNISGHYYKY